MHLTERFFGKNHLEELNLIPLEELKTLVMDRLQLQEVQEAQVVMLLITMEQMMPGF